MHLIKLNLEHGSVYVDSSPIEVDENGVLRDAIKNLCSPPINISQEHTRYKLLRKVRIFEQLADGIIEIKNRKKLSVTFLFDLVEFFESSILESKIIKACEKSLNLKFASNHPSTAFLGFCEWGSAVFFYDAKQGDLSLEIKIEH